MKKDLASIRQMILKAAEQARIDTQSEPEPEQRGAPAWPLNCTVGPGLEGAIACESRIGYVNGAKGWLVYRGYDIFDLAANATFEEVCYLLLHNRLPNAAELAQYKSTLFNFMHLNQTLRLLMGFPLESMSVMAALRLGTNLMRQEFTEMDRADRRPKLMDAIGADEDSIAMETAPLGDKRATFEFKIRHRGRRKTDPKPKGHVFEEQSALDSCYHLIAGVSTLIGAVSRIHQGKLPLEPDPELSHAGNLLFMITGRKPTPLEERIMDIALILHADHGMNASTFASMVVASTLADIYFSIGSGIAALSGPLHGGANEAVLKGLQEIGAVGNVKPWVEYKLARKAKISGFGHRVYKTYDPRARILSPLADLLTPHAERNGHLLGIARELERVVSESDLSRQKKIFPNVDFYSGIVYSCLGMNEELFTPLFAASRVAGWTARVFEYIQNNRIFRPRAIYVGQFNNRYVPIESRS
jgi:citrate synthase